MIKSSWEHIIRNPKTQKNYNELISFLKRAQKSLRIDENEIEIHSKIKNGILIEFLNAELSIMYTYNYFYNRTYEDLKENVLVCFILYKCNINLKYLIENENITLENREMDYKKIKENYYENIDFSSKCSLKKAGEIYLKSAKKNNKNQ